MTLTFDPSINLGNLLVVVSILGTALLGMRRIGRVEQRLDLLWGWFKQEHNLDENGTRH